MKRRRTTLDWESSDELPQDLFFNSEPDPPQSAPSIPDADNTENAPVGKTMVRNCIGIGLWSTLLTVVIFVILTNQAAEEERTLHEQTVAQVQQTVDIQQRQSTGSGQPAQSDLIDDSAPPAWQTECLREKFHMPDTGEQGLESLQVAQIEFCGDQVLADLLDETTDMRVTRAYRQEEGRWLRTTPASECWGEAKLIESTYFRFMAQERDVQTVEEAMGAIDRLYLDMREQIGLAVPGQGMDRHLIVVDISRLTADILIHEPGETATAIHLPSPSLVVSPAHLDESDVLLHTAAAPIAELVISDKLCADTHTDACDAYPRSLVVGLTLWLQWHGSDLISWTPDRLSYTHSWQAHLAQYDAPPFYRLENMATADIDFWLQDSPEINIMAFCATSDDDCWTDQATNTLVRYGYLLQPYVAAMAAESMIEWLEAVKGPDVIPKLINAIDEYDDFPSAMEAVSGMSVSQAQREWHAYLARHQRDHHSLGQTSEGFNSMAPGNN